MPDVFLSYKREDLQAATRLVEGLRGAGLNVWWDRDIVAGAPWEATIESALAGAKTVLVCWSPAAVASENVRSEARWARERGRLVQVFVKPCEPPLFFGERQGVDLADWPGDPGDGRFKDLVTAIQSRMGPVAGEVVQEYHDVLRSRAARPAVRRKPLFMLAGAALCLAVLAGWFVTQRPLSVPPADRLAILPFTTPGGGDDVKAFAAGVTDELTGVLSENGRPIVSGPRAQGLSGPDAAAQARKLGVGLVFGGSAERVGDRLKVRVRVDDPRHSVTVWTAQIDGAADQSEALQGQLGARIIAVLNCSAKGLKPKQGLSDPDAMTLLLKACDIFEDQVGAGDSSQPVLGLLDTCRQLVAKAPDFAAGHSLLAKFDAYYRFFLPAAINDQLVKEAMAEREKAMRLDPEDADASVALYLLRPSWDYLGRDRAIMGVPFDPSWPYGENFKGAFLGDVGRTREALAATQRAVAANPLSLDADAVQFLVNAAQTREAEQELARLSRLWPASFLWADRLIVAEAAANWAGLQSFVDDPAQRSALLSDADASRLSMVYAAARTRTPAALARARAALLDIAPGQPVILGDRVAHLAWLGFVDDAFALAGHLKRGDLTLLNSTSGLFGPLTTNLRRDPRFMSLAARLGLVDYWRKTGKWPDFCAEPGLPYDCKAEAAKLSKDAGTNQAHS